MRISTLAAALALSLSLVACEAAPTVPADGAASAVGIASTNQPPVAAYKLTVLGKYEWGYSYKADGAESYDPDGTIVGYEWVEDGVVTSVNSYILIDGLRAYNSCSAVQKIYLTVTDNEGATATTCVSYTPL